MTGNMDHACRALVVAVDQAVPGWVLRCVRRFRLDLDHEATVAGAVARNEVIGRLEALFSLDVAEQRQNPLAVLRQAVIHPTAVLRAAAVPPVLRDDFERANFPDDVYGLSPSTWTDIDPALRATVVAQMHEYLAQFDAAASDYLDAHRGVFAGLFPGDAFRQFEQRVQDYAFADARAQLQKVAPSPGMQPADT